MANWMARGKAQKMADKGVPSRLHDRGKSAGRAVALLLLILSLAGIAVAESGALPSAWQQKAVPKAFSKGSTLPRVDRGYLISFRPRVADQTQSNISVRPLAGGQERALTFWISGASEIRMEDLAMGPTGQIYVAGSRTRPGDPTLINFLAELDQSGNTSKVIDLGAYRPKRVCVTDDGSLWTFGVTFGGESDDNFGARLLRQYSPNGQVLHSYLPSKKFPTLARVDYKRSAVTLSCGVGSVGVYLAQPARWIEVPLNSSTVNKWRVQPTPQGRVTGVVLRGPHEVYATFTAKTLDSDGQPQLSSTMYKLNLPPDHSESGTESGGVFNLLQSGDRLKANWTALAGGPTTAPAQKRFLLGRDDQSLVYVSGRVPGQAPTFYWIRP